MTYPSLSEPAARELFEKHQSGTLQDSDLDAVTDHADGFDFDQDRVVDLSNMLWEVARHEKRVGAPFERRAISLVHDRLQLSARVGGDAGFWRWLTFSSDGSLAELVDWRYGKELLGGAKERYYGFDKIKKGMYGYLWLCADAVYDPTCDDPYELTRLGDVDIWQSHIVKIDFGSVPQMARAFLQVIFPEGLAGYKEKRQALSRLEYRKLASELSRRNASSSLELLGGAEAVEFVQKIWEERREWMGSS